ncbi:MAG: 2OG-Fe dioxygenase family protein [Sphingomonadales bacterium]|nr:2OG-Fe dioxygenase family protein [Sphingomonadales bacterium]MDE2172126.1 2OG-Fe dioxygenase family protein [Sphingomonadales bacterium]
MVETLANRGFVHLPAPTLEVMLGWSAQDWSRFAASWDRLGTDGYMADGGRYRLRRHATFTAQGQQALRQPHQPHYQSRDYNALNGGVQRWFEPVEDEVAQGTILASIFETLTPLFARLDGREDDASWHSEVHQFRIETSARETGRPTPEGFHRDGVDWVLVLLVGRRNVEEGTTEIAGFDGAPLGRFTLCQPGDAVLLDDRRIMHGVTPIQPHALSEPAWRDALVVTWRADDAPGDQVTIG